MIEEDTFTLMRHILDIHHKESAISHMKEIYVINVQMVMQKIQAPKDASIVKEMSSIMLKPLSFLSLNFS